MTARATIRLLAALRDLGRLIDGARRSAQSEVREQLETLSVHRLDTIKAIENVAEPTPTSPIGALLAEQARFAGEVRR